MSAAWSAAPLLRFVETVDPVRYAGSVTDQVGLLVESAGPAVGTGDFCEIQLPQRPPVRTQVVGFRNGRVLSMPLEETDGLPLGARIVARPEAARVAVGPGLLGRVLDGFGQPIDAGEPIPTEALYDLYRKPPGPMERATIETPLATGIRAIDSLLTCGKGQRIGLFGGSGVGKSTLVGSMARNSSSDVSVIALVGERNREVPEFLRHELGPEGLARSVVVCSTSEQPAPLKLRAAFVAIAIAEYFRDQGKDVLLVLDSITRLAMAQREIGLAAGEPPSQKGYTPSVFSLLPKVCERAGCFPSGSITAFFTVLVDGDDMNEPIADAVRSILDGHIVLSRELGMQGHYPAIDVLQSISRLAGRLASPEQKTAAAAIREALAEVRRSEDLVNLGAYAAGSNPKLDAALRERDAIQRFLRQDAQEQAPFADTVTRLLALRTGLQ